MGEQHEQGSVGSPPRGVLALMALLLLVVGAVGFWRYRVATEEAERRLAQREYELKRAREEAELEAARAADPLGAARESLEALRLDEALEAVELAVAQDPTHEAYLLRARIELERGDPAGARQDLARALELSPAEPSLRELVARAQLRLELDDPGALADLDAALARDPSDYSALEARARLREAQGDLAGARADLRTIVARQSLAMVYRVTAYQSLGSLLEREGSYAEAVAAYGKALDLYPNLADLHYARGMARLAGALPGAEEDLAELRALARTHPGLSPDHRQTHAAELVDALQARLEEAWLSEPESRE